MGFFKKIIRKVTKPVSKVLDKIIPNEIKPLLPYAAAAVPFMMGPAVGMGGSQGLMALLRRGLLTGALPNSLAQLAQEGNEGELNPLSLAMATGSGIFSGQGAGDMFRGAMNPGKAVPLPGGSMPGQTLGGFKYDASGLTGLDKAKNFMLKGGAKLADTAAGAGKILRDPFAADTKLLDVAKAAAFPVSQATGDLAYAEGARALKEFNAAEAAAQVAAAAAQAGFNQEYIDAITSSMGDYGYNQEDIDEIIAMYGFANGGRVGFAMGGGDFSEPNFMTMREVIENVNGDEMEEGIMEIASARNRVKQLYEQIEAGVNVDESMAELYQNHNIDLYNNRAMGGIINTYNMGGSVLPQGMEMDYRQGGMIPMGSKERADDVPARVSKNEFVMTADAVRGAGGGDINEGAKRMYETMNRLEARA